MFWTKTERNYLWTALFLFLAFFCATAVGAKAATGANASNKYDDYIDVDDPFDLSNKSTQASASTTANVRQSYTVNPSLQAQVGLRTVMMSGMLYGLSLLPAVMVLFGSSGLGTLGGALASLGKRSISDEDPGGAWLPFLPGKDNTARFLSMLHQAFRRWNVVEETCRQLYVCEIYRHVTQSGLSPELDVFQQAVDTIFKSPVSRNRRDTGNSEAQTFYEAARVGADYGNCTSVFSTCPMTSRLQHSLSGNAITEDQLIQPDDTTNKTYTSAWSP